MNFHSLHSKIFLLMTGTLLLVALAILGISHRSVTTALTATEQHAVGNLVHLAQEDIRTRWENSLLDKVDTVQRERAALTASSSQIISVFRSYEEIARKNGLPQAKAQQMAIDWLARRPTPAGRNISAFDASLTVRASTDPQSIGKDISGLQTIKGQPLAAAMRAQVLRSGEAFAVYHRPDADGHSPSWNARFVYFRPWDWVIAVSSDSSAIQGRIDARQAQMERELADSLGKLQLAKSGFLALRDQQGRFIVAPPNDELAVASDKRLWRSLADEASHKDEEASKSRTVELADNQPWFITHSHFAPLGWTLAALVPESDFVAPAESLAAQQFAVFLAVFLIAWLVLSLVTGRIVAPVGMLARFVHTLPEQDLTREATLPAAIAELPRQNHDEIGQLAQVFITMNQKLHENVAKLVFETDARGRIENELRIASDIQLGLLPTPLDAETRKKADVASTMHPAKEVGGDLTDYFLLADGKSLCLAIGDVSGKGVPAALFMAITRTLIRSAAEVESDPARIVERVNNRLSENNPNLMFVTLLVGILQLDTGELRWCNAGHPPPYRILPEGGAEALAGRSGIACGIKEGAAYKSFATQIKKGEAILAYTDGVTEAVDSSDKQYGEARLEGVLAIPAPSAQETIGRIGADVLRFSSGVEQFDDITLIAARRL
jgi:sigma-B regulation protein RsbU (phosphoserine phosphatase)